MASSEKGSAFFHPDRAGMDLGFQPSPAAHMDDPPTMNDPSEMSAHLEMPGFHGQRETHLSLLFDDEGRGCDPAGADAAGGDVDLSFGPEHADNAALNDG